MDKLINLSKVIREYSQIFGVEDGSFCFDTEIETISAKLQDIDLSDNLGVIFIKNRQTNADKVLPYSLIQQNLNQEDLEKSFAIISSSGDLSIYTPGAELFFTKESSPEFVLTVKNCVSYLRLFNHFIKKETPHDLLYDGHHNSPEKEIILYSSIKGIFKIMYSRQSPEFVSDVTSECKNLEEYSSKPYKSIFINALFTYCNNNISIDFKSLIENAKMICGIVQRDYELLQRQFDFEKFRDVLLKEKDKYFATIREVVGKIFSQLIAVPISISAATYSAYKIDGDSKTIILIFIAFVVYTIFYLSIQIMSFKDLRELQHDFRRNFVLIKSKSGLNEALIRREYNLVQSRFRRTKCIVIILISVVAILSILVSLYMGVQFLNALHPKSAVSNYYYLLTKY